MSDRNESVMLSQSVNAKAVPRLVLVLGGARSGKSTFAERLAASSGRRVAFIATATAHDNEMRERIARHRASRPDGWQTLEEPLNLTGAIRHASALADVLLLDCITLWLSNLLGQQGIEEFDETPAANSIYTNRVLPQIDAVIDTLTALEPGKTLIAVTNEVGLGIVPAYPLGRHYRDMLGLVNQRLACAADRVYLMIAGQAVDIKQLQEDASL